jgi:hypothetical protein
MFGTISPEESCVPSSNLRTKGILQMDDFRNHTVSIRFDPEEFKTLTALSGFSGLSKGGTIRHLVRSYGVMLGFLDDPKTRTTLMQRRRGRRKPDEQPQN